MSAPETFGPYLLIGKIADGGMAQVHHAIRRSAPEQIFALKRILPKHAADPEFRRFFALERGLTCALHHPNIVEAFDSGTIDDTPYLAMEYIHGRALNRILAVARGLGRRLPLPQGVAIAIEALRGLDYVHHARDGQGREIGAVLCDISPSNVMVAYDGQVKLIDFGIASSRFKFIEQLGMLRGKKNYLAPEQLRGLPIDGRADLYAMAVCLVEILTSQPLFQHRTEFEMEEAIRSGRLPRWSDRLPSAPPTLLRLLDQALSPRPEDRPSTAAAFAEALAPFARLPGGQPVGQAEISSAVETFLAGARQDDDLLLRRLRHEARAQWDPGVTAAG